MTLIPVVDPLSCSAHGDCAVVAPAIFRVDDTAVVIACGPPDLVMAAADAELRERDEGQGRPAPAAATAAAQEQKNVLIRRSTSRSARSSRLPTSRASRYEDEPADSGPPFAA
jgi:hypothetical protein